MGKSGGWGFALLLVLLVRKTSQQRHVSGDSCHCQAFSWAPAFPDRGYLGARALSGDGTCIA